GQFCHMAVTPDGPRGPRRQVQPGVVYLASRMGLPIVPMGIGFGRTWRAKSWDQFALPRPGSRAVLVTTEPIIVPGNADREVFDKYRQFVESEINRACELAEQWAAGRVAYQYVHSSLAPPKRVRRSA